MNERIKQLAEQTGMTRILDEHAHEYGNGMLENTQYPELEKFAELIVQECADLCDRFQARNVGMQPAECAGAIRKMFGVEL
jgi:hypothetical protein